MFDGTYFIRAVPGFELTHGPLLALWTPCDANRKFFANTGEPVVSFLLSLFSTSLDGFGNTPEEAEADLLKKIEQSYDESEELQHLMRRSDGVSVSP